MRFFTLFLCTLLSSALFSLGIPNEFFYLGAPILGFSGIIVIYYVLLNCKTYKQGALLYAFHTMLVHLFSSFWLAFFEDFAIFTLGGTTLLYFVLPLPFGLLFSYVLKKKAPLRIFSFAAIWLLWEFFKSSDFLAYPWGTTPMFCFKLKYFIQFIDTTGIWGLSLVVPAISAALAEILYAYSTARNFKLFLTKLKPFIPTFSFLILIALILNLYGIIVTHKKIKPKSNLNVVVVQQNSDPWDMYNFRLYLKNAQELTKQCLQSVSQKPDLIVWSENSLPIEYADNKDFYQSVPKDEPFMDFLKKINTPILVGTLSTENEKYYNSAYLLNPNGDILNTYSKMKLVAFAEYMPLLNNPIVKALFEKIVGFSSGYSPGADFTLFSIENSKNQEIKFTTPICFEDAFPRHCIDLHNLGSELFINITNDSWSKTNSAEYQHFVVAYFRAIELRTTLIRSTNSGFSTVIDPYGNIIDSLPLFEAKSKFIKVPVYEHTKTSFALFKNWLPLIVLIILIKIMLKIWIENITARANASIPSQHWVDKKIIKKRIRRYKPFFAVKRKKTYK